MSQERCRLSEIRKVFFSWALILSSFPLGGRGNFNRREKESFTMFYPEDVKESVLKQILTTSKTVVAIARENNIPDDMEN
ncbi:hypothetical protein JCM12298_23640 [Desulfothermus naphthae]